MLLGELAPEVYETLALAAVLLVHQARPEHPERDLLAVESRAQRRLEFRNARRLRGDEVAEIPLARELPELAPPPVAVDRGAERERGVELGQACVALVDRREVVRLLLAGEVEVRLLVELRAEPLRLGGEIVDLALLKRFCHGRP